MVEDARLQRRRKLNRHVNVLYRNKKSQPGRASSVQCRLEGLPHYTPRNQKEPHGQVQAVQEVAGCVNSKIFIAGRLARFATDCKGIMLINMIRILEEPQMGIEPALPLAIWQCYTQPAI